MVCIVLGGMAHHGWFISKEFVSFVEVSFECNNWEQNLCFVLVDTYQFLIGNFDADTDSDGVPP